MKPLWISILASLIGLVMFFAVKTNGDVKEVGRILFALGLLVTLAAMVLYGVRP